MAFTPDERALTDHCFGLQNDLEALLSSIVCIDSGSGDPEGIQRVGLRLEPEFAELGFSLRRHVASTGVPHLVFTRSSQRATRHILLTAHLDTVYEKESGFSGYRVDAEHAIGPGVVDCKGGVAVMLGALRALNHFSQLDLFNLTIVLNGDEETGSLTSRDLFLDVEKRVDYALVFEGARPSGAIVNRRYGNGGYVISARGRSAHAAVGHADGVNAIDALARKVPSLSSITDYARGVTLNVGVISGGTKRNIVPDFAQAVIDVRFQQRDDAKYIDDTIRKLCATSEIKGATITIEGGPNRPPWPPVTPEIEKLTRHWIAAASDLGVPIVAETTPGGSDGNWTADMGIPTLDGLGPVGGKYHTVGEFLKRSSLGERTAVAALAIQRLS